MNKTTFAAQFSNNFMPNFQDLGLIPELLQAVAELGFTEPMPVQSAVIPVLLNKPVDIVGLAETGTGKTAAFSLPILQYIKPEIRHTQAVILCPTRELCMQITADISNFAKFLPHIHTVAIYGGASIEGQINKLREKPQIVVGTPGRMYDMIRRSKLDLSHVKWVVLDEADEMLDMGFQEDLDAILEKMPDEKHSLLFSATMPAQVEHTLTKYMKNPLIKTVGKRNVGAANVKHIYYMVQAKDRYLALKRIADYHPNIYAIVFCRTRKETQEVADMLIRDGYNADALHGDLSQAQRDSVMNRFRQRSLQMLIATDVAARGLDVSDLSHVINYNLPDEPEAYIHRSGRTGRADKQGVCISIINLKEKGRLKQIQRVAGREFAKAKVPTGVQVCEKQLFHHIDRMEKVELNHEEIDSFLPVIYRKLEWMNREEIIKRFVALEFNRFLEYYRDAKDLNVDELPARERKGATREQKPFKREERKRRGKDNFESREEGFTTLMIRIGRKDNVGPHQIIGIINEFTRTRNISIGRIDMMDHYSLVDIDTNSVEKVLESFDNPKRNRSGIRIELPNERNMRQSPKSRDKKKQFSNKPKSEKSGKYSKRRK